VLQLDGTTAYAEMPPLDLNGKTLTVTAWVRRGRNPDQHRAHLQCSRCSERVGNDNFGLHLDHTGTQLRYTWFDSTSSYNWESGLTPPVHQWFFVALVVTPTDATLYLDAGDGLKSATNTIEHAVMPLAAPFRIGHDPASSTGPRYWNGAIDDVRIWNRALSAEEIETMMSSAPRPTNRACWRGGTSMKPSSANADRCDLRGEREFTPCRI
jgi:hypothetical protein